MKTILFASLVLLMLSAARDFVEEYGLVQRAASALSDGRASESVELYDQVERSGGPNFLSAQSIVASRQQALIASARKAIESDDYRHAAIYLMRLSDDRDSPLARTAEEISRQLIVMHMAYAERLFEQGDLRAVGTEVEAIRKTYRPVEIQERAKRLEWQLALAQAERALHDGDERAVLAATRVVPEDSALPLRREADNLIQATILAGGERRFDEGDFPGLYRYLAHSLAELEKQRPALVPFVYDVQERFDRALWGSPIRRIVEIAPIAAIEAKAKTHANAAITIRNGTARRLDVHMRGPEEIKVSVKANEEQAIALRPGEYVQLARGTDQDIPFFGIVTVGSARYQQVFAAEFEARKGLKVRKINLASSRNGGTGVGASASAN